jgi:RNA polymerase sigma-32 factor
VSDALQDSYRLAQAQPMLSREDEIELARAWRDRRDRKAYDRLILAHLRLSHAMARQYQGYRVPQEDLLQQSNIALLRAAETYDPDQFGTRFATYASLWIKSELYAFIIRNLSIVRPPETADNRRIFFGLSRHLRAARGENPELSEDALVEIAAEALGVPVGQCLQMLRVMGAQDVSTDAPVRGPDGETFATYGVNLRDEGPSPEEACVDSLTRWYEGRLLRQALADLTPRERDIIESRRMVDPPVKLDDLAARHGVSRERIRQIETNAFAYVRATVLFLAGKTRRHPPKRHPQVGQRPAETETPE